MFPLPPSGTISPNAFRCGRTRLVSTLEGGGNCNGPERGIVAQKGEEGDLLGGADLR